LYEEYGKKCVDKLRGMFAFAIWDNRYRELFIVRDRLGIKPIYYYKGNKYFCFASEIKAIIADKNIKRAPNYDVMANYLSSRFIYGENTMFQNIYELLPGHAITINSNGKFTLDEYWDLDLSYKHDISLYQAMEYMEELLTESVNIRMISDVPLGAFLSGGIDSSIIVALMAKLSDKPIECFSVGFYPREESEIAHAKKVATYTYSHHNTFEVDDTDFFFIGKETNMA
jgi:asparagine synthase (glutamine-hydrolysing)